VKPASGDGGGMTRPHYLDACFLCKRSISRDSDIFMYKYALTKLILPHAKIA
jgi:hypothetical protein